MENSYAFASLQYKESIMASKRINCTYFGGFSRVSLLHGITSTTFLDCSGKLLV